MFQVGKKVFPNLKLLERYLEVRLGMPPKQVFYPLEMAT